MFKKTKKTLDKRYTILDKLLDIVMHISLFLVVLAILFRLFRILFINAQILNENLWIIILTIMGYAIISLILINLYYKIFKFTLMKPSITEKEFNKLWKKRQRISQELKKGRENKKIPHGSKKFGKKWKEIEKIEKVLYEKTVSFKDWLTFFIFSIYFGLYIGNFFWAIKNSTIYFKEATKNFFSFKKMGLGFKWYKLKNERYTISSFVYPYRKPK